MNYNLLNDVLSFFGMAKTIVCLLDELFNEENLGDTNARVLFLLDGDLQMTSFQWLLAQVRLKGRRLLLEIVTWYSEHAKLSEEDSGLKRVPKNPYHYIKRGKLNQTVESKLKKKSTDVDVQKIGLMRCCT